MQYPAIIRIRLVPLTVANNIHTVMLCWHCDDPHLHDHNSTASPRQPSNFRYPWHPQCPSPQLAHHHSSHPPLPVIPPPPSTLSISSPASIAHTPTSGASVVITTPRKPTTLQPMKRNHFSASIATVDWKCRSAKVGVGWDRMGGWTMGETSMEGIGVM